MSKAAAKRAAAARHNLEYEWRKIKPLFDYLSLLGEGPEKLRKRREEKRRRETRALNNHLLIGAAVAATLGVTE